MSEFLTVRLTNEQQAPVLWSVWSDSQQEVIASGELPDWQQLDELQPYAAQRTTIALLASSDVILTQVDIPPGGARQFETMLPYLLEDEIAQDVDKLHFSILQKKAGVADVCAVDKSWLANILSTFRDHGIEIKRVLPDTLALPLADDTSTMLQIGDMWLLRHSVCHGACVDNDWLGVYLQSLLAQQSGDEPTLYIDCFGSLPDASQIPAGVDISEKPQTMALALLSKTACESPFNLRSGEFKIRSSFLKHWKVWQKTTIAACVLILCLFVQKMLLVHQAETEAAAYRAESERIFRSIFPDRKRIPTVTYLKGIMNDEVQRISGTGAGVSVLDWFKDLADTFGSVSGMQLQSFKYDGKRDEVRLEVTGKDFQSFEQVRVKLAERFHVEQGQLSRSGDAVNGGYVLTRK